MNYKIERAPAPVIIKSSSIEKLIDLWEMTIYTKFTAELAIVRGWLMDEISSRCPDGFDEWLDSDCEDVGLRNYVK